MNKLHGIKDIELRFDITPEAVEQTEAWFDSQMTKVVLPEEINERLRERILDLGQETAAFTKDCWADTALMMNGVLSDIMTPAANFISPAGSLRFVLLSTDRRSFRPKFLGRDLEQWPGKVAEPYSAFIQGMAEQFGEYVDLSPQRIYPSISGAEEKAVSEYLFVIMRQLLANSIGWRIAPMRGFNETFIADGVESTSLALLSHARAISFAAALRFLPVSAVFASPAAAGLGLTAPAWTETIPRLYDVSRRTESAAALMEMKADEAAKLFEPTGISGPYDGFAGFCREATGWDYERLSFEIERRVGHIPEPSVGFVPNPASTAFNGWF